MILASSIACTESEHCFLLSKKYAPICIVTSMLLFHLLLTHLLFFPKVILTVSGWGYITFLADHQFFIANALWLKLLQFWIISKVCGVDVTGKEQSKDKTSHVICGL